MSESHAQVQVNIARDGQAMTLICKESEWERLRKVDLSSPGQICLTGTDGEKVIVTHDVILCVVYLSDEAYRRLKKQANEAAQRARMREDLSKKSGVIPGPGMKRG